MFEEKKNTFLSPCNKVKYYMSTIKKKIKINDFFLLPKTVTTDETYIALTILNKQDFVYPFTNRLVCFIKRT